MKTNQKYFGTFSCVSFYLFSYTLEESKLSATLTCSRTLHFSESTRALVDGDYRLIKIGDSPLAFVRLHISHSLILLMFKYVMLNVTIPHYTPRFAQVYSLLQLRCSLSSIFLWTIEKGKGVVGKERLRWRKSLAKYLIK